VQLASKEKLIPWERRRRRRERERIRNGTPEHD
jgi:hypothetical protein